jgi:hypothetical protein
MPLIIEGHRIGCRPSQQGHHRAGIGGVYEYESIGSKYNTQDTVTNFI